MENLQQHNPDNPCHQKSDSDRKFVIFDLDGTLIDSFECVLRCVNKSLASFDLPNVIISQSSPRNDIELIFNKAKEIIHGKVLWNDFKIVYDSIHLNDCIEGVKINPIANSLLKEYYNKGYTIVIITNKLSVIAEKICNTLLCEFNVNIIGRQSVESIKTDWAYIASKIADLDLSLGNCFFYIGDSEADYRLSKQLAVKFYDIDELSEVESIQNAQIKAIFRRITNFLNSHSRIILLLSRILVFGALVLVLYRCYECYQRWNTIPYNKFNAQLNAAGCISNESYCNLRLYIDAGSVTDTAFKRVSSIQIYNSINYTDTIIFDSNIKVGCNYLLHKYSDRFKSSMSFYFVDYSLSSSVATHSINKTEYVGILESTELTNNYIEVPQISSELDGTRVSTSGLVAYGNVYGMGGFDVNLNLFNDKPSLPSPWNISQSNYLIEFSPQRIRCDTISIEFNGAIDFSNMYPSPDKVTMSGIEFVSPDKISEICTHGLRFHAEFIELSGMSAQRTFILSGIVSLILSILATLILKWWIKVD